MRLESTSFPIWRIMIAVAIAACVLGACVAFADRSNSPGNVITGWACFYGIPIFLLVGRKVPIGTLSYVARFSFPIGLAFTLGSGLLGFLVGGNVGLIGGSLMMLLITGWWTLLIATFSPTRPVSKAPDRSSAIDHRPSDLHKSGSEVH